MAEAEVGDVGQTLFVNRKFCGKRSESVAAQREADARMGEQRREVLLYVTGSVKTVNDLGVSFLIRRYSRTFRTLPDCHRIYFVDLRRGDQLVHTREIRTSRRNQEDLRRAFEGRRKTGSPVYLVRSVSREVGSQQIVAVGMADDIDLRIECFQKIIETDGRIRGQLSEVVGKVPDVPVRKSRDETFDKILPFGIRAVFRFPGSRVVYRLRYVQRHVGPFLFKGDQTVEHRHAPEYLDGVQRPCETVELRIEIEPGVEYAG